MAYRRSGVDLHGLAVDDSLGHRAILSALEAGDARRAAGLLAEHWHDGGDVILLWLAENDPASAGPSGKPPR